MKTLSLLALTAVSFLGVSRPLEAVSRVGCGHETRLPRIELEDTGNGSRMKLHGAMLDEFVRRLGYSVGNDWKGYILSDLPLYACHYSKSGLPIASCDRRPAVFKIYNADDSLLADRIISMLAIRLYKHSELHAGGSQDQLIERYLLKMYIDWELAGKKVELELSYTPSTCSAK